MTRAAAIGHALAERHRRSAEPDPERAVLNYAESPRIGDWSLRSALVRLAQPEPVRAGATLEVVRRCGAVLHPLRAVIERHVVTTDRAIDRAAHVDIAGPPTEPRVDGRMVDLARIARVEPELLEPVLDVYRTEMTDDGTAVDDDEVGAVPLLAVALDLDELADVLTAWADAGIADPPLDAVDDHCRRAAATMDALGVEREEGGPPRRRR